MHFKIKQVSIVLKYLVLKVYDINKKNFWLELSVLIEMQKLFNLQSQAA